MEVSLCSHWAAQLWDVEGGVADGGAPWRRRGDHHCGVVQRAHHVPVVQPKGADRLDARPGLHGALAAARDALVAHL